MERSSYWAKRQAGGGGAVWEKEKVASTAIALYLIRSTITLAQSERIFSRRGKIRAPRPPYHVNDWGAHEGTVGGRGSNARGSDVKRGEFDTLRMRMDGRGERRRRR